MINLNDICFLLIQYTHTKMATGGLFQLIAYGAQDLYITANPQIDLYKNLYKRHNEYNPKSLQDMCISVLTERQKTWIVSHRSSFPDIADIIIEPIKQQHQRVCSKINKISMKMESKCRVTHMLLHTWWSRYNFFDENTVNKTRIRYLRHKETDKRKAKEMFIHLQKSQQRAIQHEREIKKQRKIDNDEVIDLYYLFD